MQNNQELLELANGYFSQGDEAFNNDRLEDSIALYQKASQVYERIEEREKQVDVTTKLGLVFAQTGHEDLAIDTYLQALDLAIINNYKFTQARIYNNIGNQIALNHEYKRSIPVFMRAFELMKDPEVKKNPRYHILNIVICHNLAQYHERIDQLDEASRFLALEEDALRSNPQYENYRYPMLTVACKIYWKRGNRKFAYEHVDEIVDNYTNEKKTEDFLENILSIIELLMDMADFDRWQRILEAFERFAELQDKPFFYMMNARLWAEFYKIVGDTSNSQYLSAEYLDYSIKYQDVQQAEKGCDIAMKLQQQLNKTKTEVAAMGGHVDMLTGIGDMEKLKGDFEALLLELQNSSGNIGLGIIDIADFHRYNEEVGYLEGDELLRQVAKQLETLMGEYGMAYRLNADCFAVLVAQCDKESLHQLSSLIQTKILVPVTQGFMMMEAKEGQELSDYEKGAREVLEAAKAKGKGQIEIREMNLKDYHAFFTKYCHNLDEASSLEENFRSSKTKEEWMMSLDYRRIRTQEIYDENEELLAYYIQPILDGTENLTEEVAMKLAEELWDMRNAGYMDNLVMLEVAKVLEKYLEPTGHSQEHIYLLVILGEGYGRMNYEHFFDMSYFYYHKLNMYRSYLPEISKRTLRKFLYEAYLKADVSYASANKGHLSRCLDRMNEELDYYNDYNIKEILRLSDQEGQQMMDKFVVDMLTNSLMEIYSLEGSQRDYMTAYGYLSSVYKRQLLRSDNIFDVDDKANMVYLKLRFILGEISVEEYYSGLKEYFLYHSEIEQGKIREDDSYQSDLFYRLILFYVPELVILYGKADEGFMKTEKSFIDSTIESYMIYMSSIPKGDKASGITLVLYQSLGRMLKYLPDWVDVFTLVFKILVERNIDNSIHCKMVSEINKLILDMVYRNDQNLLVGSCGFNTLDQVADGYPYLLKYIENAGYIHDIGKIEVNDIVSLQTRHLTELEMENYRLHPEFGASMLDGVASMEEYIPIVLGHHRFFDDTDGYPVEYAYSCHKNPFLVNILQLSDCLEEATDSVGRAYAESKTLYEVMQEVDEQSSKRFHPELVRMMQADEEFQEKLAELINEGRQQICFDIFQSYQMF